MHAWDRKHAGRWRRSNPTMAWRLLRLSIGQPCRRSAWRNTDRLENCRAAQQRAVRLLSFSANNLAAVGSNKVSFVFGANMHLEKDATALNKCKPQKV